jgi:hypothetical protein
MFIESRLDGTILKTRLELRRPANGRAHFVLSVRDSSGHRTALVPVAAAVGYRLVTCTVQERMAMLLAGVHLAPTESRLALSQLHSLLSTAKKTTTKTRRPKKPKDPLPSKHGSKVIAAATPSAAPERFGAAASTSQKESCRGQILNGRHGRLKRPSSPPGKTTSG